MLDELAFRLAEYGIGRREILFFAVGTLLLAAMLKAMHIVWRRAQRAKASAEPDLTINADELSDAAPPTGAGALAFYNMPVRLSAVILAPAGRASDLPVTDELAWYVCEGALPHFSHVVRSHEPQVYRWPTQLSVSGFGHAVMRNLGLPGLESRERSRWSVVAGVVGAGDQSVAVALVLCAETPNTHGWEPVENEGDWRRVLTISL